VRERVVRGPAPAPGVPGVATRLLLQGYVIAGEPAAISCVRAQPALEEAGG
jgi:hypothetical protein